MFIKIVVETPDLLMQVLHHFHRNGQLLDYAPVVIDGKLYTQVMRVKGDFAKINADVKTKFKKKVRIIK